MRCQVVNVNKLMKTPVPGAKRVGGRFVDKKTKEPVPDNFWYIEIDSMHQLCELVRKHETVVLHQPSYEGLDLGIEIL